MPYHVIGYTANTFGVNNYDSSPLQDAIMPINNAHYFPWIPLNFYAGWFSGTLLTAAQLVTPTTRQIVPPRLYPINAFATPPDRPHMYDRRSSPWSLNAAEEISMQFNLGGAANAFTNAVMFVGTSLDPVPVGNVYTYHGVSTNVAAVNAWTQIAIVWDQPIPNGTYVVTASQHQSATGVAHRLIFKDQQLRPGMISLTSLTNIGWPEYNMGGMGKLGQFTTTTPPIMEVWCGAADASHDIVLSMIRVA
jgi:hypothetical protein